MNLDDYGPLDYGLIRLERYFAYERAGIMARNKFLYSGADRAVSLVTSRGCPYNCSFCSIHIHAGRRFRTHSVEYVVSQIAHLVSDLRVRHIHFEDDNLTLDRERFIAILAELGRRGLQFTWDTPNGVFAGNLDEDMLAAMKKSGCVYIGVGVESGDQWVLDNIVRKQPLRLDAVTQIFAAANRVGIDLHAFYVIGFPGESMTQISHTLKFAFMALRDYDVIPHLSLARADPGTSLFREAVATSTLVPDYPVANAARVRSDMFPRHVIATQEFTPRALEAMSEVFHRRCIGHVIRDRTRYLLLRPGEMCRVLAAIARDVLVQRMTVAQSLTKLFWCKLLYRNAMTTFANKPIGQPNRRGEGQ